MTQSQPVPTAEACRAARGLVGWTLDDLARAAGVGFGTLSRFENGRQIRTATAARILAAFAAQGVELLGDANRTGAMLTYAQRKGSGE